MGTQKVLLPWEDTTVIGHIVSEVLASRAGRVVVVVSPRAELIRHALNGLDVDIVENPDTESAMLDSVRIGLLAAPDEAQGYLVLLGDQPRVRASTIDRLIAAWSETGRGIVVPTHDGRRGHPLLLSAYYVAEVATGHDVAGLRGLLDAHADEVLEVDIGDAAVLSDMDSPEDYQRELLDAQLRGECG